ncbi:MAG: type II toxin-antitoxin system RelE/ParE family toxin [Gallionella sp.]
MIKSFKHKGIKVFFETGSRAGIQPHHAKKLRLMLTLLDNARQADDMNVSSWDLHPLTGDLLEHYSVSVNGNWRMTFKFAGENAILVDYQDYH